jgi:hypothetical protein
MVSSGFFVVVAADAMPSTDEGKVLRLFLAISANLDYQQRDRTHI